MREAKQFLYMIERPLLGIARQKYGPEGEHVRGADADCLYESKICL